MTEEHRNPDVLHRLYHVEGLTMDEIADRFEVAKSTIQYQMNKHGISRRIAGTRVEDNWIREQ